MAKRGKSNKKNRVRNRGKKNKFVLNRFLTHLENEYPLAFSRYFCERFLPMWEPYVNRLWTQCDLDKEALDDKNQLELLTEIVKDEDAVLGYILSFFTAIVVSAKAEIEETPFTYEDYLDLTPLNLNVDFYDFVGNDKDMYRTYCTMEINRIFNHLENDSNGYRILKVFLSRETSDIWSKYEDILAESDPSDVLL